MLPDIIANALCYIRYNNIQINLTINFFVTLRTHNMTTANCKSTLAAWKFKKTKITHGSLANIGMFTLS